MEVGPAHKSNSELKSREVILRTPKCEAGVAVGAHVADAQGLGWRPGCGQAQGHASFVQCDWMDWDAMGWHGMGWDGMAWDGMGWDAVGCDGMRCDAM